MPGQGDTLLQGPTTSRGIACDGPTKSSRPCHARIVSLFLWPSFSSSSTGKVGVLFHFHDRAPRRSSSTMKAWREMARGQNLPLRRAQPSARRDRHALSADGLTIEIAATVLFRPVPDRLGRLHKEVGPYYVHARGAAADGRGIRDVVGKISPHDLYRQTSDAGAAGS